MREKCFRLIIFCGNLFLRIADGKIVKIRTRCKNFVPHGISSLSELVCFVDSLSLYLRKTIRKKIVPFEREKLQRIGNFLYRVQYR